MRVTHEQQIQHLCITSEIVAAITTTTTVAATTTTDVTKMYPLFHHATIFL